MKRTIDSEIWSDDDFMDLAVNTKLLLLGIMTNVNDSGEMQSHPAFLSSNFLINVPGSSSEQVNTMLAELVENEFIEFYDNDNGKQWLRLNPKWLGKRVGALDKGEYGHQWKGLSCEAKRRDGYACTRCGKTTGRLIAHHIKPLGAGGKNKLDNLTTLCQGCHRIVHAELGDY